ncbi:hypothetical protein [Paraburkholderia sp. EG304]|uniref:hypothetical protein n=1 Tax=Paraburkholderia sp. EG304 TaxID=3237015 RepID=UPI003979200E
MTESTSERREARLKAGTLLRIVEMARERGQLEVTRAAYADVCKEIDKALAEAEDELTRSPEQQVVMGQIIALSRLAAHFAPAPEYYARRIEQFDAESAGEVEQMIERLRELDATLGAQETN